MTHNDETAGQVLPQVARWSVEAAFHGDYVRPAVPENGFLAERKGVFVTLWKRPRELRGCIGSLDPQCATLLEETWRVARQAAFSDRRFEPVTLAEIPSLLFKISVLGPLEPVGSENELDPERFGIVVRVKDGRRGALLPGVDGIGTPSEQINLARRKGAIGIHEPINIERFAVRTFEEAN